MENYDAMSEAELMQKVDEIFFDAVRSVAPDISAEEIATLIHDAESANDDNASDDDDDHGSTVSLASYEFHWALPDAVMPEDTINKIGAVPTADMSKYNPNTLANLCVANILATKMGVQTVLTTELHRVDGERLGINNALLKKIMMFMDPAFASDLGNASYCYDLVRGYNDWLPNCWCEVRLLKKYGVILALVACNTPSTLMLARNLFNMAQHQPQLPSMASFFRYSLDWENLPNITAALIRHICYNCHEIAVILSEELSFTSAQSVVLHKHMRAFLKRYLPEFVGDAI
jgi:hypothetical protein